MFTINAEVRKEQGKGASRRLRAANKFPAIIYGGAAAPVAIELDHDKVWNMQDKAEFYSEVLTVVVDGKEEKSQSSGCSAPRVQAETDSHRLRSRVIADSKLYGKRPGVSGSGAFCYLRCQSSGASCTMSLSIRCLFIPGSQSITIVTFSP